MSPRPCQALPSVEEQAPDWAEALRGELEAPYMEALRERLNRLLVEAEEGADAFYPPPPLVFNAFATTPLDDVRVVIVGQDPYHGPGQAHGLCFSVPEGCGLPPSLRNIFRELRDDLGVSRASGDLTAWAAQGVLLLNTALTVAPGHAASHRGWGWELFTDAVIDAVAARRPETVFVLWGSAAQAKGDRLPAGTPIVRAPHPSPLSAYRGFFGSRPFSLIDEHLARCGQASVDWGAIGSPRAAGAYG